MSPLGQGARVHTGKGGSGSVKVDPVTARSPGAAALAGLPTLAACLSLLFSSSR